MNGQQTSTDTRHRQDFTTEEVRKDGSRKLPKEEARLGAEVPPNEVCAGPIRGTQKLKPNV